MNSHCKRLQMVKLRISHRRSGFKFKKTKGKYINILWRQEIVMNGFLWLIGTILWQFNNRSLICQRSLIKVWVKLLIIFNSIIKRCFFLLMVCTHWKRQIWVKFLKFLIRMMKHSNTKINIHLTLSPYRFQVFIHKLKAHGNL